jgi:hypothetical protein
MVKGKDLTMKKFAIALSAACLLLASVVAIQAQDKPRTESTVSATSSPAETIAAAVKAIEAAKADINADKKGAALERLDEALKLLAKAQTAASAPAAGTETSANAQTLTGTVESTHSQKRPRLVVGDVHYELKAAETANASVKETLAKISSGEATGKYTVKGTVSGKNVTVESITKD